jgi:hypothetical protein
MDAEQVLLSSFVQQQYHCNISPSGIDASEDSGFSLEGKIVTQQLEEEKKRKTIGSSDAVTRDHLTLWNLVYQ